MLKHVVLFTNGDDYSSHCAWVLGAHANLLDAEEHAARINGALVRCPKDEWDSRIASSELVSLLPTGTNVRDEGAFQDTILREGDNVYCHHAFVISVENPT